MIASDGHIADFYVGGYLASGDDLPLPHHDFNSLADFMGTSQDSVGNVNGSTTFYYWDDASKFTYNDASSFGVWNSDGMYGITEYMTYAGYGVAEAYTQLTDNFFGTGVGFTFADYMAEIDAGRVVMIHVAGHSMYGYGYDPYNNLVLLHDTWTETTPDNILFMAWGGAYSGLTMWGVTCFTPAGGTPIPEPSTLLLLGTCLAGLVGLRRRFMK